MSAAADDLLGGHFQFEQEAPPYLPNAPPPIYKPKSCVPHDHHLSARLSGFDLAESIWSQDSDLTLDDLALSFDSTSSRSSMSSHWSAPPLTPPSTSRHLNLHHPPSEPAALPAENQVQESEPEEEEPDSPVPAYSRDPLEFDPAILASLDSQLRLRPFEAFEDMCRASFCDAAPVEVVALSSPSQTVTLSLNHQPSMSCMSFTADSAFSDTSTTTMLAPHLSYPPPSPPPSPSQPPPAYPASKPLPTIPPPSPIRTMAERIPRSSPPVVMTFKSPIVSFENSPIPPATPVEGIQLTPLRPQTRPRSKSAGGQKPVQRLTTAIARLRGRE